MKWLIDRIESFGNQVALVHDDVEYTYGVIRALMLDSGQLDKKFTPGGIAAFLSAAGREANISFEVVGFPLLQGPGPRLILWSSGLTGQPKGALHDLNLLAEKFEKLKPNPKHILAFLGFDHIGGINTFLHTFSTGGCLVVPKDRKPQSVVDAIEKNRVQIMPVTPTFLNMLILSGACEGRDLSSLELITYGTEPMPESTLKAAVRIFPSVKFKQTYGLSELGILSTQSRDNDSTWVKLGGDGYQVRVREGLLEIKAKTAMLGYLNAPSPFTEDGWFMTGDAVEQDGEWLRILGRKSELINVGGEKVYPAEIESLLEQIPGVVAAVVKGEPNPLTGNLISASVVLTDFHESQGDFRSRMRQFMTAKGIPPYKVPHRIEIVDKVHSERFKKSRV